MQQSRLLIMQFVGLILEARFAHSRIFIALKFCVKKPQTFTFHIGELESSSFGLFLGRAARRKSPWEMKFFAILNWNEEGFSEPSCFAIKSVVDYNFYEAFKKCDDKVLQEEFEFFLGVLSDLTFIKFDRKFCPFISQSLINW